MLLCDDVADGLEARFIIARRPLDVLREQETDIKIPMKKCRRNNLWKADFVELGPRGDGSLGPWHGTRLFPPKPPKGGAVLRGLPGRIRVTIRVIC